MNEKTQSESDEARPKHGEAGRSRSPLLGDAAHNIKTDKDSMDNHCDECIHIKNAIMQTQHYLQQTRK